MEKVNIYNLDAKKKGIIDLPKIFTIIPRYDIIQDAYEISQSKKKQKQGRDPKAGLRSTAEGWGTGHGLSRAPRIKGSGFPTARNVGRVPFAVGGRMAFPTKTEKVVEKKINKKAKKLSILFAISASGNGSVVKNRGHKIESVPEIPLVIDDKVQTIKKTGQIHSLLYSLGFGEELIKIKKNKKIRAGKGKRRGRKYKNRKGILIVIKEDFGIVKASRNIPGVDIATIENLSIDNLAPGGLPGRLTIWAQSAFNELNKFEELI